MDDHILMSYNDILGLRLVRVFALTPTGWESLMLINKWSTAIMYANTAKTFMTKKLLIGERQDGSLSQTEIFQQIA